MKGLAKRASSSLETGPANGRLSRPKVAAAAMIGRPAEQFGPALTVFEEADLGSAAGQGARPTK
jgi:hypothetical protein